MDQDKRLQEMARVAEEQQTWLRAETEALRDALDMPKGHPLRLSANVISQALRDEGIPLHMKSIETHRKGACRCSKHESGRASNAK